MPTLRLHYTIKMLKHSLILNLAVVFMYTVATGFPAGQTHIKTRLEEIKQAVQDGAKEIDIVINRAYALAGNWKGMY